jgi:paraquat-inducible protein A
MMDTENLIACHECDLLHRIPVQQGSGVARCRRCNALLHRSVLNSLDRTLALTFAGMILFIVANSFPFLAFKLQGQETQTTLISGVKELYDQGMWEISILVLLTTIIVPLLQLIFSLYVLLPLKFNRIPWKMASIFRITNELQPWSMMEVFLIGILVSVVKLVGMAQIIPGLALWSFALLIVILAAASVNLDPQIVWKRVEYRQ